MVRHCSIHSHIFFYCLPSGALLKVRILGIKNKIYACVEGLISQEVLPFNNSFIYHSVEEALLMGVNQLVSPVSFPL